MSRPLFQLVKNDLNKSLTKVALVFAIILLSLFTFASWLTVTNVHNLARSIVNEQVTKLEYEASIIHLQREVDSYFSRSTDNLFFPVSISVTRDGKKIAEVQADSYLNISFVKEVDSIVVKSKYQISISVGIERIIMLFILITILYLVLCMGLHSLIRSTIASRMNLFDQELFTVIGFLSSNINQYDGNYVTPNVEFSVSEVASIHKSSLSLVDAINQMRKKVSQVSYSEAIVKLAKQVAHDIRSPLSALNMVMGTNKEMPEEKRLIMRRAVQRINDIANGLLKQGKEQITNPTTAAVEASGPVMLLSLLDSIVSEKRTQFREKIDVEIEGNLANGHALFSNVNPTELSRVISNLVNNSIEAFENSKGKVIIGIQEIKDSKIEITIEDNGKGIAPNILAKLGERGVSHGKEGTQSGSGLGVAHAIETVKSAGGTFDISSDLGLGTKIALTFPKCEAPQWFVKRLQFSSNHVIVSVDDDQSIHQIWAEKFASMLPKDLGPQHLKFTSLEEFAIWVKTNHSSTNRYLIDYEFLDQNGNGLELIERLQIPNQSILVTSRFDEPQIQTKAHKLGLKILPKGLAPLVPIEFEKQKERYDAILIDDDPLMHMTWKMAATQKAKRLACFANPDEFFSKVNHFDFESAIMIDVNLANGVRGEDVARKIIEMGFIRVYLATGYDPMSVIRPKGLIDVIGKDPLFP